MHGGRRPSLRCVGLDWIPMTCKGQPSVVSPHRTWLRHASPTSSPTCVVGPWLRTCRPTPLNAPTAATVTCFAHGDATDRLASRSVAARFAASVRRRLGRRGSPSDGACRLRHAGSQPQQRILDRRHGRRGAGRHARSIAAAGDDVARVTSSSRRSPHAMAPTRSPPLSRRYGRGSPKPATADSTSPTTGWCRFAPVPRRCSSRCPVATPSSRATC